MLTITAEEFFLLRVAVKKLEANIVEVVFGDFLGTYLVETSELGGSVTTGLGGTVVTEK